MKTKTKGSGWLIWQWTPDLQTGERGKSYVAEGTGTTNASCLPTPRDWLREYRNRKYYLYKSLEQVNQSNVKIISTAMTSGEEGGNWQWTQGNNVGAGNVPCGPWGVSYMRPFIQTFSYDSPFYLYEVFLKQL